ncbi:MAG: ABC transporter, partial [Phyllobacterium sp.]
MTDPAPSRPEGTDKKRRSLKPLRGIFPYMARYKGMVAGAMASLVLAAVTTLTLPLAVRRMIDHGFTGANGAFINNYFGMLVLLAALLALASAGRYFFVITLGERIISDQRR